LILLINLNFRLKWDGRLTEWTYFVSSQKQLLRMGSSNWTDSVKP